MSTITLEFTNGQFTELDATGPWYASYYLHGAYEVSTVEGPGVYTVSIGPEAGWQTVVDTKSFQPIYSTNNLLAFTEVPPAMNLTDLRGSAVPEASTWAMMLVGFVGLGYAARRRAAQRVVA